MTNLITLIIGLVIGYFGYAIAMKVNYKQRVIEDKKNLYLSVVRQWLKMRNFIYDHHPDPQKDSGFDRLFAETIGIAGGILLVSGPNELSQRIETLTETIYRKSWSNLDPVKRDEFINEYKKQAWEIIKVMRSDIRDSSRLELSDLLHIFGGLLRIKET